MAVVVMTVVKASNDRDLWHGWDETHSNVWVLEIIGYTAPGITTDSITGNHPCPKLREVRDEQCPHGPLEKGKFYCSCQIPPALNSRNPFPRLFVGRGKTPKF